jgi:hypothetical protein
MPDAGRRTAARCDAGFGARISYVRTGLSGAAIQTTPVGTGLTHAHGDRERRRVDSQSGRGMWQLSQ